MKLDDKIAIGDMLLRELVYGHAKSKKTWWAAKAAEANFNVVLLDGDDGWHILTQIDKKYHKRINVIDFNDTRKKAVFCVGLTQLLKQGVLLWDEKEKKSAKLKPNEDTIVLDVDSLTHHDVLVVDSWTALVWSLIFRYALENQIDLTDPEKQDWDFYRWGGNLGTWILEQLQSLKCHIIVIAHGTMYEKRDKDGKNIEWSKQQIVSTSGPHAMTIPGKFSDVLEFYMQKSVAKISTEGNREKDGGSRIVPPKIYNWDDLQFADICKMANCDMPDESNRYLDLKYTGEIQEKTQQPTTTPEGGTSSPINKTKGSISIKLNSKK